MLAHLTRLGRPIAVAVVALFLIAGAVAAGDVLLGNGLGVDTPSGRGILNAASTDDPVCKAAPGSIHLSAAGT